MRSRASYRAAYDVIKPQEDAVISNNSLDKMIGKQLTDELKARFKESYTECRFIRPGELVTSDSVLTRFNVKLDAQDIIKGFYYG